MGKKKKTSNLQQRAKDTDKLCARKIAEQKETAKMATAEKKRCV